MMFQTKECPTTNLINISRKRANQFNWCFQHFSLSENREPTLFGENMKRITLPTSYSRLTFWRKYIFTLPVTGFTSHWRMDFWNNEAILVGVTYADSPESPLALTDACANELCGTLCSERWLVDPGRSALPNTNPCCPRTAARQKYWSIRWTQFTHGSK